MDERLKDDAPGGPEDSIPVSVAEILRTLTQGDVQEEHGLLAWGSNYAYLVPVADEERALLAVYKPQRGERPLWDFPEGTLCQREVAAFHVSELLGWDIVPPTVLRGGPYGLGSLQFFVDHDPEVNYFTPFSAELGPQLQRIAAFDVIINNTDRKGGHCILDTSGHLWGIDHGVTFHSMSKLRTVIWEFAGQSMPDHVMVGLEALGRLLSEHDNPHVNALRELLSEREFEALHARVERARSSGRFPQPGPGPNYPWPPV